MAKELRVTIVGDSTALQAALARASGATAGFAGSVRAAGAKMTEAGAVLTKGITAPVALIGGLSVKAAVDFQNAMELIHTQAGVAQSAIAGLSKDVLGLAGPTATAPETLSAGLYHLTSQGLRGAESMKALRIAAEGAKMGQADLEDVTNALGAVLSSKIGGVHSYGQAMGELNATVGAGDMRMQDLADAMGTGLPAKAELAGVKLHDVAAALATLGDNNIRGAEAGTLLNSTIRLMEGPSKAAARAMAGYGISAEQLGDTLRNKGLLASLEMLHEKLGSLSKTEQYQALTHMFGGRQSGGIQVLMDQIGRFKTKLEEVDKGGKTFADDWSSYTKTAAYHLASMGAQMQASGVTIGNILLPLVSRLTNFISGLLQKFDGLSESTKKFIMVAAGIAAAIGPALSVLGNLIKVVMILSDPVVLVAVAIGALVAAMVAAVVWPDKLKAALERVGLSAGHASEVIHVLQTAFNDIKAVAMTVVAVVEALWRQFGSIILAEARTIWNTVVGVIRGALNVIRGVVNVVTGLIHGNWSQVWRGIQQIVSGAWQIITSIIRGALQTLANYIRAELAIWEGVLSAAWRAISSAATGAWHAIESAVVSVVTGLVHKVESFFKALPGRIKAALGDVKNLLVSAGHDIVKGLIAGIEGEAGSLLHTAEGLAGKVKGVFKSALGIFSPSRVMAAEVGLPIAQGIGVGIDQGSPAVQSKAAKAAAAAVAKARQAVADARDGFVTDFGNLANSALQAFDQKVQAWVSPAQKLLDKMQADDQVNGAQRSVDQAKDALDQAQAALDAANSPAGQTLATLTDNANTAQEALDNLKASGTASAAAIKTAQGTYNTASAALKAFKLANPDVAGAGTDTAQLVAQVTQAQQAYRDALRAQQELNLQLDAAAEQKKHDKLMAIQRDNMAKQLYELQQALLKHPAAWNKAGNDVEKILHRFGVTMAPAGQRWANMFANGIESGIPAVRAAAHRLADAVDRYMPHSPAKTGPLSYDAATSGKAWADRFAEGFAGAFPDVNGMTASRMARLAGGDGGNAAAGNGPLIGEVHVHNDTDVEVMASRVQRRLAFEMR